MQFFYKLLTGTQGLLADNQGLSRFLLRLICEETFFQARICRRVINFFIGNNVDNIDLVSNYLELFILSFDIIGLFSFTLHRRGIRPLFRA